MRGLKGKVAIVAGAAPGNIGAATAVRLAEEGAAVVAADLNEAAAAAVVDRRTHADERRLRPAVPRQGVQVDSHWEQRHHSPARPRQSRGRGRDRGVHAGGGCSGRRLVRRDRVAERVRAVAVVEIADLHYRPGEQQVVASIMAPSGRCRVVFAHSAATSGAIDSLARALSGSRGDVRFVAGHSSSP